MQNFEKIGEKNYNQIDKEVFDKLNHEVERYIMTKVNKLIIIIESADFNFNKAELKFDKKVINLIDGLKTKFFSNKYIESIDDILKRKIIKVTLEAIAEKRLDGSLSFFKNLEDKYSQVLLEEASFYLKNNQSFESSKDLIKFLNQKKILDNNIQGDMISKLEG